MSNFVCLQRLPGEEDKHWLFAERTHVMSTLKGESITIAKMLLVAGLLLTGGTLLFAASFVPAFVLGTSGITVLTAFAGGALFFTAFLAALYIWRGKELPKDKLEVTIFKHQQGQVDVASKNKIINGGETPTWPRD